MTRLFINGGAASAGGGLTYLRNVIPHLAARDKVETTVLLTPELRREFGSFQNVSFVESTKLRSVPRRFFHEQSTLPSLVRKSGAQFLISAGNFALWRAPVPQILLSRNSLYTSSDFLDDVRSRQDYAIWADTMVKGWLAKRSILRADVTVAPSEAFARELSQWSGRKVVAIHHGFDSEAFTSDPSPLPAAAQAKLEEDDDCLRLLFVSHYNYYRNFETLFRALPLLKKSLQGKNVKLYLTCQLNSGQNAGAYRTESAAFLVNHLRAGRDIVELGSVPYGSLHHLYRACHVYVTPAYTESFAHPLVEAMSSGLPVVASDLAVHREICGEAGIYFPSHSSEALVECILRIHESPELAAKLSSEGRKRSRDFSWSNHVDQLLALGRELVQSGLTN